MGPLPINWIGKTAAEALFKGSDFLRSVEVDILGYSRSFETRGVFHTSKGYIGIGPPGMQPLDRVVVILRFDYPVLLRPVEKGYLIVSVCVVIRIMHGEVMQWVDDGLAKVQDFGIY